jgi:hypothetical protein
MRNPNRQITETAAQAEVLLNFTHTSHEQKKRLQNPKLLSATSHLRQGHTNGETPLSSSLFVLVSWVYYKYRYFYRSPLPTGYRYCPKS